MFKVMQYEAAFRDYMYDSDLDENDRDLVRDISVNDDCHQYEYSDGDYYYRINFDMLDTDTISDELLEQFIEEDLEESDYPNKKWQQKGIDDFYQYLMWLKFLRKLAKNIDPEYVTYNKFAIYICN